MSDSPPDEEAIFKVACQIASPEARAAYLNQECAGNPALLPRIAALLQVYEQESRFLESPPPGVGATMEVSAPSEKPGTQIGPYKLLQQIGEGGMGIVYMAEQTEPVQRKVALKVIKPGMATWQVIARFEAERQALSLMDHPNIAKVLDAGTTDSGRPYFVMELVKGQPITQFCDEKHLTPRQRLELLLPVCQAIQHAHQKGIIHRDIKPTNILVAEYDQQPVPKVIDFGVAKATSQTLTEKTMFTGLGQIVGTLEYMSPEQAKVNQLDIDTRSDIYSLGVLLYELLTGSTPFDRKRLHSAAFDEMLRIIREEEPPKPSTRLSDSHDSLPSISAQRQTEPAKLTKLVRGELDWIVMKALDKDRNRRYETANGLAQDLQRYLNDEPVQACPPSARYRFAKFARRNRAAVLTATAILSVMIAGIAGTTFGLIRAEHRRAEAEQARTNEAAQLKIAEAQKKKAEIAEAITLADYRASTDDAIEQLIAARPELGPGERAFLERTLKRWQVFAARQGDDQRSRAIQAEGRRRVASLWLKLGRLKEARAEYETALELILKLNADYPGTPQYQTELMLAHSGLAYLLNDFGEREASRKEFLTALDLSKKLSADFPNSPSHRREVAYLRNRLGVLLRDMGQVDAARTAFETSRDLRKKLAAQFPKESKYQFELSQSRENLGVLLTDLGQCDAARTELEAARDIQQKVAADYPAVAEYRHTLSFTHNSLGVLLAGLGQYDGARKEFERACELLQNLVASFPAVTQYQKDLASFHLNLGDALDELGRRDAARESYESARDLLQKLPPDNLAMPENQASLALAHRCLGVVLGVQDQARVEFETACDICNKLTTSFPTHPDYLRCRALSHKSFGILLNNLGEGDASRKEFEEACNLLQKLTAQFPSKPRYQIDLGGAYCNFGYLVRKGDPADSLHWFDLAISTLTPVYEQDHRVSTAQTWLRNSYQGRAETYDELKNFEAATKDWEKLSDLDPGLRQRGYQLARAISLSRTGQATEAVAQVEEYCKKPNLPSGDRYRCGCILANASGCLADRKQELADRAMEFLNQAVEANFNDLRHMARDSDLTPLREREDFQKLVAGSAGTEFYAARARLEKLIADFPKVPQHQLELARSHRKYAMQLAQLGLKSAALRELGAGIDLNQKLVGAFPAVTQYQIELGSAYNGCGFIVRSLAEPAESLRCYDQAIRTLTPYYERNPRSVTARLMLRASHSGRAWSYDELKKYKEATHDWDQAIQCDPEMEQIHLRAWRAVSCLKAGGAVEVVAEVDQFLTTASLVTAGDWHSFACVYAVASGKFAGQKQMYGDRAMELLRRAVQAGYMNGPQLAKDPNLEALRERQDFQKLLAQLESRTKNGPAK